ncbi:MAG: nucleotidyltransferase family protein [Deltaproteobacteria bacterium]|nr:nucleotidyltransferase family protein [Deltaproteobacteria bacterium]
MKIARDNNVSQMLYPVLKKSQNLPDRFIDELKRDYLSTAAKNTLIYREFKRVVNALTEKGIDVMAMKGIALAELTYKDIGLRGMSDVDLLIRKEDIKKANNVFEDMGYFAKDLSSFDGRDNYLTTCDFRSKNPMHPSFHMHWHIVNSSIPAPYASRINMDEIWKDAVRVDIADVSVLSMSPHHFLIHLCEHAMRVTHSAAKLTYFADIAFLVNNPPSPPFTKGGIKGGFEIDWRKVIETSKNYGVDRFAYNILMLCRLNIGLDVPEWVLDRLKPEKRTIGEKLFYFLTARGKGFSGLSYFVHLGMNRGIAKKASFIFRTVFPPAWVLAKRDSYSNADKSAAALYLYRIREILSHLFLFPIQYFKKVSIAFICATLLFNALPSIAGNGAIEKNSAYTTEFGLPEYLVAADDVLEVTIWMGFEAKKYDTAVKPNGFITVTFVEIKASDLTTRQVEAELKKALSAYIKEPRVEVFVKEYRGRTVTLLGAIQSQTRQPSGPGIYPLKGKTILSKLITSAGGFSKDADLENVQITSAEGRIKKINLFHVMFGGEISQDIIIDAGEAIYIPAKTDIEESNVFIFGEVQNPGAYKLKQGLTLVQAIGMAKGYKEEALIDEIRVIRGGLDKPQIVATDVGALFEKGDISKDITLQKNDIIYIPKTKIANWNAFLAKIRPTLEFIILPFVGARAINQVTSGE